VVFVDTSYLIALFQPNDQYHAAARRLTQNLKATLVTTDWVLLEFANSFSGHADRVEVAAFIEALNAQPDCQVVAASREGFGAGLALFRSRTDKHWSLTDCISFLVMREQGIREALTADRHFAQAGFVALLEE
jgi:predicted nucleic acid-binding protein